jgi:hypothetical protein
MTFIDKLKGYNSSVRNCLLISYTSLFNSQNSIVIIVTRVRTGNLKSHGSVSGRSNREYIHSYLDAWLKGSLLSPKCSIRKYCGSRKVDIIIFAGYFVFSNPECETAGFGILSACTSYTHPASA